MIIQEQADILFCQDSLKFVIVLVILFGLGISTPCGTNLVYQVAQCRLGFKVDPCAQVHPDLRAVVAPQDRAVLYQGDPNTKPSC